MGVIDPGRPVHSLGDDERGEKGRTTLPKTANKSHQWVVAAVVGLPDALASTAFRRGTARLPASTKIDVLEVYCQQCRRPYERVVAEECEAAKSRDHLIGGPTGERAKRKHADSVDLLDAVADVG